MRRRSKIIIAVVLLAIIVSIAGFTIWAYTPLGPMPEALSALQSDSKVTVTTQPWIVFTPTSGQKPVGFIIYPGARVDPRSYAPAAHALAAEGYLTVIVPMPFNLAIFGSDSATGVMAPFPSITSWAVGGALAGRSHGSTLCIWPSFCCRGAGALGFLSRHQQQPVSKQHFSGLDLWCKGWSLDPRQDKCVSGIIASQHDLCGDRWRQPRPVRMVWFPAGRQ